jgi:hypothetical protein
MLTCKYGCTHGGLVEMLQMPIYATKHCLQKGNYLHKKKCFDCKQSIEAIFEKSKNKAVFYYCQADYNVAELDDDNKAEAQEPCACILCLTCYFKRETTKNATTGKTTRSSGRRGRGVE